MITPPESRIARPRRRIPRWLLITILAAALVVVVAIVATVSWGLTTGIRTLTAQPPGVGTRIVVPSESKAATAAASTDQTADELAAAQYLAAQPTAYWLTPEADPSGEVGDRILGLASEAREQDASIAIVIYGLPERDCSAGLSAGGLDDADYDTWTAEIGTALNSITDVQKIVVLEPDSLSLSPECGNLDQRVVELRAAIENIKGVDTWVYLDGGHSNWLSAQDQAALISQVGELDTVRGFALNVSNYNDTASEFAYAHEIADILGTGHALIDTSRNGAGADGSVWCNPPGRLVGDVGGTYGDDVVDTNLWLKPPGESDGECNGGPVAGTWWPEGAVALTSAVR